MVGAMAGLSCPYIIRAAEKELLISLHKDSGDRPFLENFSNIMRIKLQFHIFDDNEYFINEIAKKNVKTDILLTTTRFASVLHEENLLRPINFSTLTNYNEPRMSNVGKYNLSEKLTMVPVSCFFYCMGYNKNIFPNSPSSWGEVLDKQPTNARIHWQLSIREDLLSLASLYQFNDFNFPDPVILTGFLQSLKDKIKFSYNPAAFLAQGNADIIVTYSYVVSKLMEKFPHIGFSYPKEGTAMNEGVLVMPNTGQNADVALEAINKFLVPQIGRYVTKNSAVTNYYPHVLRIMDNNLLQNPLIYPDLKNIKATRAIYRGRELQAIYKKNFEDIFYKK